MGTIQAQDTVHGSSASCYVVIGGKRYNFAQAISLEAKVTKNKAKVPILGQRAKGNKASTVEYSGNMKLHYNNSIMRKLMLDYTKNGVDAYFDIEVTIDDKASTVGTQSTILYGCNLDSIIVAKFDADSDEYMDEEFDFTFENWDLPQAFTNLAVIETV